MSDKTPKSPYINYTEEQIVATEAGHYVIQVGSDFYSTETGKMAFSKERAEQFYETVLAGLMDLRMHGTDEEYTDATACLLNLRILPLRIH